MKPTDKPAEVKPSSKKDAIFFDFVKQNQIELSHNVTNDPFDRLAHEFRILTHNGNFFYEIAQRLNEYDKLKADNARMLETLKYIKKCLGVLLVAGDTPEKRAYNAADIAIDKAEGSQNG